MNGHNLWRLRFVDLAMAIVAIVATIGTFWIAIVGKEIPPAIVAIDTTIVGFLFGRGSVSVLTPPPS